MAASPSVDAPSIGRSAGPRKHDRGAFDRWAKRVAWVLVVLAFVRAFAFVSHDPMIGLANNYDMLRVEGCIEAYPVRDRSIAPETNSWIAPLDRYEFRDDTANDCFLSTEALFAFAAYPLMKVAAARSDDGAFSLRMLGYVKVALLFGLVAVAVAALPGIAALVVAALSLSVLADGGVLIYANAMYAEFAAAFFLVAVLLALVVALCPHRGTVRDGQAATRPPVTLLVLLVLLALATLALALSKALHLGTGLIFAVLLLFLRFRGERVSSRLLATLAIAATIGLVAQVLHVSSEGHETIRRANLTNSLLWTLLPQSDDVPRATERLGLPRACAEHAGKNWYTPGVAENPPCPELYDVSRARLFVLAATEPMTLVRVWFGGLMRVRPWIPKDLGVVEGERIGKLPPDFFTWTRPIQQLPEWAYAIFVLVPLWVAFVVLEARKRWGVPLVAQFLLLAFAVLPYAFITLVVFGDGYADPQRHGQLVLFSVLLFWHLLAALLALRAVGLVSERAGSRFPARFPGTEHGREDRGG